jgi:cobalt-zinc-cadmium efflux system outer membrane protein
MIATVARIVLGVLIAICVTNRTALAQAADAVASLAARHLDPAQGLSLDQAIARALEQEPSLRSVRSTVDEAQGRRLQATLRPNPSVSVERREEPAGTDNATMVAVEWPLDLFRRSGRVAVADRELTTAQLAVADRERLL